MTWLSRLDEWKQEVRRLDRGAFKKTLVTLYALMWNSLRACAGLVLVLCVSSIGWFVYVGLSELPGKQIREAAKRAAAPKTLCGKIAGVVYEFPKAYEHLWAEYEGKSSWEVGFVDNKKGCDANFVSVPLAITWPEMAAASYSEASKFSFNGLLVQIVPNRHGANYLNNELTYLLSKTPREALVNAKYNYRLNLNFIRGGSTWFSEGEQGVFWREDNGVLRYVGSCEWLEQRQAYSRCLLYFLTSERGGVVSVEFLWGRIKDWESIAVSVKEYIKNHIKK